MKHLTDSIRDIQAFRLRLARASASGDELTKQRLLKCLVILQASFFDQVLEALTKGESMRWFLIFSDEFQDGKVMTEFDYRQFTRGLVERGAWSDLKTHTAVQVDAPMVADLSRSCLLRRRKATRLKMRHPKFTHHCKCTCGNIATDLKCIYKFTCKPRGVLWNVYS